MFEKFRKPKQKVLTPVLSGAFNYAEEKSLQVSIEADGWTSIQAHGRFILGCTINEIEQIGDGYLMDGCREIMRAYDAHLSTTEAVVLAHEQQQTQS